MTDNRERVFLVDLEQPLPGYRRFLSAWIYTSGDFCACIDCGPASTIPVLVERLRREGLERLDFVLLTHIHLDHGGGIGQLLEEFPDVRVWCHPRGREHIVRPERLWKGSLETIGEVARVYGEPLPVGPDRLASDGELEQAGIGVVLTPGHAPHHASFVIGDWLFAGEAVATRMRLAGGREYLRPATPPRFLPDVFLKSLKTLEQLDPRPRRIAFAHYGVSDNTGRWYERARRQLELWLECVGRWQGRGRLQFDAMIEQLVAEDPDFAGFTSLPDDIRRRERFYVENSLRGMWRYLEDREESL